MELIFALTAAEKEKIYFFCDVNHNIKCCYCPLLNDFQIIVQIGENCMNLKKIITILTFLIISLTFFIQCPPEIPDTVAPVVNIIYPVQGQAVSGLVKVTVGASDETELKQIDLFVDGARVKSAGGPLLEYDWDTAPIADNRNHSLYATATDKSDNNGYNGPITVRVISGVNPDTLPPVISILNPISGSIVADTVTVVPQITDDSPIDHVDYYVNGKIEYTTTQVPYEFEWNVQGYLNGTSLSLFARAFDINLNNSVSNVVTVTVQNTDITPPSVLILYPPAGTVFTAGDTVIIAVDAQDNFGIQRVDLYIDGELKITDTSAPYRFTWYTAGYGDGRSHSIYVKAFDFAGNTNTQLITVTVNP
jgi:subtilisin